MIDYAWEHATIDHCPACGTLRVRMEDGYVVVARHVETGAVCAHSYAERTAMMEAELATLHLEARAERERTRRRGPRQRSRQLTRPL
ncbi:MAG TPA: hypothetical protein VII66_05625 [Gemmatimonadaceae bacterium]|jgi:uncharacterized Zn finger protein (UPF0148 family)